MNDAVCNAHAPTPDWNCPQCRALEAGRAKLEQDAMEDLDAYLAEIEEREVRYDMGDEERYTGLLGK
jgi:hypothetical protein